MNKIFISPERRVKPHGKYWGMEVYEHDVCCEIATMAKALLSQYDFEVFIASPGWSMEQRCAYANQNGFDYYLCVHTNATGNGRQEGTATGAECLYYNHPDSIKANKLMYEQLTALYPSRRGCKDYSRFAENNLTQMVSCYPELAFHDNGQDARWLISHKTEISLALCRGVCGYFGVEYREQPQEPASGGGDKLADERAARIAAEQRAENAENKLKAIAELIKNA